MTTKYSDYKVLLDNPATEPGLGFEAYSSALAEVILHGRAEFVVGIFGQGFVKVPGGVQPGERPVRSRI
jgi:hypothetical protein